MSSSPFGSAMSLARQRHQAPPKVEATLSTAGVSQGRALDRLCQFLESEKAKLSHLDLQPHWVDLHGVAAALCRDETRALERHEGSAEAKKADVDRCRQRLERMQADVDADEFGGGGVRGGATTPASPTAKHIVFDADDGMDRHNNDVDNNDEDNDDRATKKRAKKEKKKEAKKAAKRERKEAKKKLKKEARNSSKR